MRLKIIVAVILWAVAAGATWADPADPATPLAPSPERIGVLIRLVRQDCGSCHGLTLRGGLGPALLPETLRDKPFVGLKNTILLGRPGTAMPPWQPSLSAAEAGWIVEQLLQGFPKESRSITPP